MFMECKSGKKNPASELIIFSRLLKHTHAIQLINENNRENNYDRFYADCKIRVMSYEKFFAGLI